jgi:hypothetical protein
MDSKNRRDLGLAELLVYPPYILRGTKTIFFTHNLTLFTDESQITTSSFCILKIP